MATTPFTCTSPDAIVVGAGLGGLTCAAYLTVAGKQVVVVDRHFAAGGNATVFTHEGFEFDVGVHYVGDCEPGGNIPTVLEPLGIELTFREMDPDGFDIFLLGDGDHFEVPRDPERFRVRLHEHFPDQPGAIDAYVDTIIAIDASLHGGPPDAMIEYLNSTLEQFFDSHDASPRLRTVLAGEHGTYALPPSRASFVLHAALVMHYLRGAFYPEGGGQTIADRLVEVIEDGGGAVVLRTPVEQIIIENDAAAGIKLHAPSPERARGVPEELRAPLVISNADLKRTMRELVGVEHLSPELIEKVDGYEMALPLFVLYLIIDRDLAAEGRPNANVFVMPHDDVETDYAELEAGGMPDAPMAYLTFTSLKDPTNTRLCREGQTNLQVMTLAPSDPAYWGLEAGPAAGERYRRNPTYLKRKAEIRDKLLDTAELAVPGIRDHIVFEECATPMTHERFVRSTGGTSYGIACTPEQFALNRPGYATEIPGLWIVGASSISAHGISAVMSGGVAVASAILGGDAREIARSSSVR